MNAEVSGLLGDPCPLLHLAGGIDAATGAPGAPGAPDQEHRGGATVLRSDVWTFCESMNQWPKGASKTFSNGLRKPSEPPPPEPAKPHPPAPAVTARVTPRRSRTEALHVELIFSVEDLPIEVVLLGFQPKHDPWHGTADQLTPSQPPQCRVNMPVPWSVWERAPGVRVKQLAPWVPSLRFSLRPSAPLLEHHPRRVMFEQRDEQRVSSCFARMKKSSLSAVPTLSHPSLR